MMKKFSPFLLGCLMWLSIASPAQAQCDGCVVGAVNRGFASLQAFLLSTHRYDVMWELRDGIVAGLRDNMAAASNANTKSLEYVAQANSRAFADQDRMAAMRRYAAWDNPCGVAGVGISASGSGVRANDGGPVGGSAFDMVEQNSMGAGAPFGRGAGSFEGARAPSTGSANMDRAIRISKGKLPAPPPEVQAQIAAVGACEAYVSANGSVRAQSCSAMKANPGRPRFPNADVTAETILGGPQTTEDPSKFKKNYTWDTTDKGVTSALEAFMRNLGTPVQLRDLRPGEVNTDNGRRYTALKDAFEARISLAEAPIKQHVANHSPDVGLVKVVEALAQGSNGAFVNSYMNKAFPQWKSKGLSVNELMNLEVQRRYYNPEWFLKLATAPDDRAILIEQLQVQAFNSALLWRLIQDNNRMNVAQAAQIGAAVRTEMQPQLNTQHELATR